MISTLLLGSIGALGTGPLIAQTARTRPSTLAFIDGFILVSIGGLVLLDVVPHALEHRDLIAGLCMIAGFTLPSVAEKLFHYGVRQTHTVVLALALLGLAAHSALDGSAIAQTDDGTGGLLGVGVLLHQLPVSLMVWWVLSDRPRWVAWVVLVLMAAVTVLGYLAEPRILAALPEQAGHWFEGLVGGSLLHVIAHPAHEHEDDVAHGHGHSHGHAHAHERAHAHAHDHDHHPPHTHDSSRATWANGIGALCGIALLVVLYLSRRDAADTAPLTETWEAFRALAMVAAPFVLLAYVIAAVVRVSRRKPPTAARVDVMELVDASAPWVILALVAASLVVPLLHGHVDSGDVSPSIPGTDGTALQGAAVVVVALLFATSIVRRGARGFLGALRVVETS